MYSGIIVEESLDIKSVLSDLRILSSTLSEDGEWHMHRVMIWGKTLQELEQVIKPGWYAHFWNGREVVAIFRNKTFYFDFDRKETWQEVIDYGLSVGIPLQQLDFPIWE